MDDKTIYTRKNFSKLERVLFKQMAIAESRYQHRNEYDEIEEAEILSVYTELSTVILKSEMKKKYMEFRKLWTISELDFDI